ncbi:MAG TPA: hypothetical protein VH702_09520 [Vicinamibacterales bacterium]|jgi:hypothetical protein
MTDRIFNAFLKQQQKEAMSLAEASDLIRLFPMGEPPNRYVLQFHCKGLVQEENLEVVEANRFEIGIWLPADYLRTADPFRVITWLGPRNIWHPNISTSRPLMCVGLITPGTGLVDLIYRAFAVITWNKVTMREEDALNWAACQWARQHPDRFPVDSRPLKRRAVALRVDELAGKETPDGLTR